MRASLLLTGVTTTMLTAVLSLAASQAHGGGAVSETGFWAPAEPLRAHYTIDCRIDPAKGILQGTETIRLTNTAKQPISRLVFYVQGSKGSSLRVSVGGKAAAVVQEVDYPSKVGNYCSNPFEDYRYSVLDLPSPLQPGASASIRAEFATPIADAPAACLVDWHPRLYWGYPTHDDFDVKVDLPSDYALVTSGRLDAGTGRYCARDTRSFGLVFAKDAKVMGATAGGVRIQLLCPTGREEWARLVLPTAVDAVNFYTKRFGFYPYRSLSIVPGGNFNVATSIAAIHCQVFDKREQTEYDTKWSTAHEIAHMYWGEWVLNREWPTGLEFSTDPVRWCVLSPLMLGMGFRADRDYSRARGMDAGSCDPYGMNYHWLIKAFRDCEDTTMSTTAGQQLSFDEWYQNKVLRHGRGYALVSALENLVGSDVFDRVYRRCLRTYGGKRMDARDLQMECEKETGQDLTWFFDEWGRTNTFPAFEVASKKCSREGNRYVSVVEVKSVGTLKTPVVVEAVFEDGSRQSGRTDRFLDVTTLGFESSTALKDVRLDPGGELPLVTPPYPPNRIATLDSAGTWKATTWAEDYARQLTADADKLHLDTSVWFDIWAGAYKSGLYAEALTAAERLESAATVRPQQQGLFQALGLKGIVLDLQGLREKALECYKEALKHYNGTYFNNSFIGLRVDRQFVEERLKTPFERK